MEMPEKERSNGKRLVSFLPTLCFLLLAALIVYGAIRLLIFFFPKPVQHDSDASFSATPSPASSSALPSPEIASEAFTFFSAPPAPSADTDPTFTPSAEAITAHTPSASPLPAAPMQSAVPSVFNDTDMDFILIGQTSSGTPDCIAAVAIRGAECTVLFLPNNTLSPIFGPLNGLRSATRILPAIKTILPVDFRRHIFVNIDGVPDCVDALGGIVVSSDTLYGRDVASLLSNVESDELIRIGTQQKLIDAFLVRMKSAGLLRYAALKSRLQDCTEGNLSNAQYLKLYQAFRRIDTARITYRILPVDSCIENGVRCYQADTALVSEIVQSLYANPS